MAKKKNRIDVVYSTNPNFDFNHEEDDENETLPPDQQDLLVHIDRKQRKGKEVTLVTGFIGTEDDLKELGKTLKQKCGTGGTVKVKSLFREIISKKFWSFFKPWTIMPGNPAVVKIPK